MGSSIPRSHWCKAATVKLASRCSFGTQEFSKSPIAPPASSNNQAKEGLASELHRFALERRTAANGSACEFKHGLVDYLVWERSNERRTDEPLPSSCKSGEASEMVRRSDGRDDTDVSPLKLGQRYPVGSKTPSRLPHLANSSRHPNWRSLASTPAPSLLARHNRSGSRPENLGPRVQPLVSHSHRVPWVPALHNHGSV